MLPFSFYSKRGKSQQLHVKTKTERDIKENNEKIEWKCREKERERSPLNLFRISSFNQAHTNNTFVQHSLSSFPALSKTNKFKIEEESFCV